MDLMAAMLVCWEVYRGAREVLETNRGIESEFRFDAHFCTVCCRYLRP
jgi:hypothetical protein